MTNDDDSAATEDGSADEGPDDGVIETATLDPEDRSGTRTPVFGGDPRAVSISLDAGESIPRHEHPGETVLLLVREGTASVTVGGERRSLSAGEIARFDGGDGVAVDAETPVSALVVLSTADTE